MGKGMYTQERKMSRMLSSSILMVLPLTPRALELIELTQILQI